MSRLWRSLTISKPTFFAVCTEAYMGRVKLPVAVRQTLLIYSLRELQIIPPKLSTLDRGRTVRRTNQFFAMSAKGIALRREGTGRQTSDIARSANQFSDKLQENQPSEWLRSPQVVGHPSSLFNAAPFNAVPFNAGPIDGQTPAHSPITTPPPSPLRVLTADLPLDSSELTQQPPLPIRVLTADLPLNSPELMQQPASIALSARGRASLTVSPANSASGCVTPTRRDASLP